MSFKQIPDGTQIMNPEDVEIIEMESTFPTINKDKAEHMLFDNGIDVVNYFAENPVLQYICPEKYNGYDLSNASGYENLISARIITISSIFKNSVLYALSNFTTFAESLLSGYFERRVPVSTYLYHIESNNSRIHLPDIMTYINGYILPTNACEIAHALISNIINDVQFNLGYKYVNSIIPLTNKLNSDKFVRLCNTLEDELTALIINFGYMAGNYEKDMHLNMKASIKVRDK